MSINYKFGGLEDFVFKHDPEFVVFLRKVQPLLAFDVKSMQQIELLSAIYNLARGDDLFFDTIIAKHGHLFIGRTKGRGRPAKIKDVAGLRAEASAIGRNAAKVLAKKRGVSVSTITRRLKKRGNVQFRISKKI